MAGTWPKVIRDPVHGLILFEDEPCDRLLLNLINTDEFQRLRRIKQLGMSQYVFPGADHSRFAHSIGVMHNARRFLDRLSRLLPEEITTERRVIVLAAALLHDVGHGPFSHTFEKITGDDHEKRTLDIILDDDTLVGQALRDYDAQLPERLRLFFDKDVDSAEPAVADLPVWLTRVVTSQLDADRFDYLRRDSRATGVDFGTFDQDWLVEHLRLDVEKSRFYLSGKAFPAVESYVFSRYHMYRAVYFHKTTRAAEVMLRLLLQRYKQLLNARDSEAAKKAIVSNAPEEVFRAFSTDLSLNAYLALDDHSITGFLKACERADDPVLKDLGGGLLHRRLFKARDASHADGAATAEFWAQARQRIQEQGQDTDYCLAYDTASDTPYKPYNPDPGEPATQIYVDLGNYGPRELTTLSEPVLQLRKKYTLLRYYFPESLRDVIGEVADRTLGKEVR